MTDDRLVEALERQAEAQERRNTLLEDQNALLYEAIRLYGYIQYEHPELRYESAERGHVPKPIVRDGLSELNYTSMMGRRTGRRPEEDR